MKNGKLTLVVRHCRHDYYREHLSHRFFCAARNSVTARHVAGAIDLANDDGPFDLVVAFAGVTQPALQWIERLNSEGQMLIPITGESYGFGSKGWFRIRRLRNVLTTFGLNNRDCTIRISGRGRHVENPGRGIGKNKPRRKELGWAARLKRVFKIDVSTCERCGGEVRIVGQIDSPKVIEKILSIFIEKKKKYNRHAGHQWGGVTGNENGGRNQDC